MRCIAIKSKFWLVVMMGTICATYILSMTGIIDSNKLNTKIDAQNIGIFILLVGLVLGNIGSRVYKDTKVLLNEVIRKSILKEYELTIVQAMYKLRKNIPIYMEDAQKGLYIKVSYNNGVGNFEHLNSGIKKQFKNDFLADVNEILNDGYKAYDITVLDTLKKKGFKFRNGK